MGAICPRSSPANQSTVETRPTMGAPTAPENAFACSKWVATDSDDETIPIFTINDFPTELIVRFAPDLRPRTVSTLRLVSRRFRDVFNADRYYRSYLCYPDKLNLYQHDLEEIGDQEGKWKLLLETEKRRLGNWREGRPARVDTVEMPNDVFSACGTFRWQGKTGEGNDHWLLSECRDQKIVLLNVTKAPILTVVDVSSYTSLTWEFAFLLPDQVVIDSGTGSRLVFNILNNGENMSLEHLFTMKSNRGYDSMWISGHSKVIDSYRSLYVSYKDQSTDPVLKVWDLKRAVQLESIDLRELLSLTCMFSYDKTPYLGVRPAGYPYVVAKLEIYHDVYPDTVAYEDVAVVNLEERQLAFRSSGIMDLQCMLEGNYMCIKGYDFPHQKVRVYDLRRTIEDDIESGLIFQREFDGVQMGNVNPLELVLDIKRVGGWIEKCELVTINGSEVSREINLKKKNYIYIDYVFGPFMIVSSRLESISAVDMSGAVMFHWADLFREEGGDYDFVKYIDLHSLRKCVLENITSNGNVLKICYF